MRNFETVLALLVGVTLLALVARHYELPTPALLVVGGLLVAVVPGLPTVQFDPQLVFLVFIPPLLYRASLLASYRDVRANFRPILSLGVGHVLFATIVVAWVAHHAVPGLPWASAFALGAVVAPPDVAAAMGIYLGRVGPRFVAADTRVQNVGMWDVVVFVLEGLIFILTGLALRPILEGLTGRAALELARGALLVSIAVVVARLLWMYFAGNFRWLLGPRLRPREPRPRWQVLTVEGWAGLRGGDTLILAAAIPTMTAAGTPFPGRDAIIALSYAVILVTLLGQGFTLSPLMRWLGVRETGDDERREEVAARLRAAEAALARLDELAAEPWMHPDALSHTRDRYRHRTRHLRGHVNGVLDGRVEAKSEAHVRLARELLAAERRELLRLRDEGAINDAVMRRVQRELDYEELMLHRRSTEREGRHQCDPGGVGQCGRGW